MFLLSLYFALLAKLKIWQIATTKTYSPQTFSVTAAVVAPAVVICLNSLILGRHSTDKLVGLNIQGKDGRFFFRLIRKHWCLEYKEQVLLILG